MNPMTAVRKFKFPTMTFLERLNWFCYHTSDGSIHLLNEPPKTAWAITKHHVVFGVTVWTEKYKSSEPIK